MRARHQRSSGPCDRLSKHPQLLRRGRLQCFPLHIHKQRTGPGTTFQQLQLFRHRTPKRAAALHSSAGSQHGSLRVPRAKPLHRSNSRGRVLERIQPKLDEAAVPQRFFRGAKQCFFLAGRHGNAHRLELAFEQRGKLRLGRGGRSHGQVC